MDADPALAAAIDALLPQTQCRQCGYSGCRPYAAAIAAGDAAINRCPPGGDEVIAELAALLGRLPLPLDPACGRIEAPAVARIVEAQCIGCTLCIAACPVDAIVGARRLMHTVIAADCTGCALCLPPCPVDCIVLESTGEARDRERQRREAPLLRERHAAHLRRQDRPAAAQADAARRKRETVARALERARARLAARDGRDSS
jgi:electron transport complex protein RnfB